MAVSLSGGRDFSFDMQSVHSSESCAQVVRDKEFKQNVILYLFQYLL